MTEKKSNLQEIFRRKSNSFVSFEEITRKRGADKRWQVLFEAAKRCGFQPDEITYWSLCELSWTDVFDPAFEGFPVAFVSHALAEVEETGRKWETVVGHLQFLDALRAQMNKKFGGDLFKLAEVDRGLNIAEIYLRKIFIGPVLTYRDGLEIVGAVRDQLGRKKKLGSAKVII